MTCSVRSRDRDQVVGRDPDVLGRDVAPVERLDHVGEVEQRRAPPLAGEALGRGADHALAAAQVELRRGRLQGHPAREPQRVADPVDRRGVVPHAQAAERRPERGRVDGDHDVEAGALTDADRQLLVLERDRADCSRNGRAAAARDGRCRVS